jgi:hypothetical protein
MKSDEKYQICSNCVMDTSRQRMSKKIDVFGILPEMSVFVILSGDNKDE